MSFESRAARAARSLRTGIAGVTPGKGFPALVRRRRLATVAGLAASTVLVAGAMALAAILPSLDDEAAGTSVPTTSVPSDPSTPAAADPTTTTKPAPATTTKPPATTTTTKPPAAPTAEPATTKPTPTTTATTTPPATTTTTKPPATTTTTTPPAATTTKPSPEHTFTANQTYGSSNAEPHTEILWGTGVPGTKVELWSPYATNFVTVAADGTWEGTLTFTGAPPGTFDFKARDHLGTKIWFTFTIEGGTEHTFTANQAYGTSSAAPPYDLFYGTGVPGTTVQIVSEYGSGSVVVGDAGQWEITVEFPDAPVSTPFPVKAKDGAGTRILFSFERTA
jgi:hypothetical protein